ncbi:hypothetical protein HDG35_005624 [Paraburkholderia sp. JPY681]|nr:hypothetical protein [Paraburkholderia atlantica]
MLRVVLIAGGWMVRVDLILSDILLSKCSLESGIEQA